MFGDIILDLCVVAFLFAIVSCWAYIFSPENKDDE